jgi:predicted aspartyl protease
MCSFLKTSCFNEKTKIYSNFLLIILLLINSIFYCQKVVIDKSYFPLIENSLYSYKGSFKQNEYINSYIVKKINLDGNCNSYYFESIDDTISIGSNMIGQGLFLWEDDGLYTIESYFKSEIGMKNCSQKQMFLSNKMNAKMQIEYFDNNLESKYQLKFIGYENITVPAGNFNNCLKFSITTIWKSGKEYIQYLWLSKNTGVVKWIRSTGRIEELVLYNPDYNLIIEKEKSADVKTKDGISLGKRNDFVKLCVENVNNEMININGVVINTHKYCSCVCDNLIPNINSWEFKKANEEKNLEELIFNDENFKILMNCLENNYEVNYDFKFGQYENKEFDKKVGIKNCVQNIISNDNLKDLWTKHMAEDYCQCAINKLYDNGYTYKDIMEIGNENNPGFNEIIIPCIQEILESKTLNDSVNSDKSNEIIGDVDQSKVPLTDYFGKGYKIKISIEGTTRYFLFDTGASDLIIDRETERELLFNGKLNRENYLGKTEYILANNEKVSADMLKVNNIIIGDYTLNNVIISVIENGSLLCGKSILDKFRRWEIDKQNKVLILYK